MPGPGSGLGLGAKLKTSAGSTVFARTVFLNSCHVTIGVNMTRPGAVAQLAYAIFDIGIFVLFVRSCFVIAGMASSTIRFITSVFPGDVLAVGRMALVTGYAETVITRVAPRGMAK